MANFSSAIFGSYAGLTILYYTLKSLLENKKTALKVISIIYYLLLVGGIIGLIIAQIMATCGNVEFSQVFSSYIPWTVLLIFGALLKVCPGWKAPFSNTFGYLVAKLMGVNETLNSVLNTNYKSKDIQKIYNDPSILINTLTPINFFQGVKKMVTDNLFNTKSNNYSNHIAKLNKIVKVKDDVAECIWYLFVGGLVSSMTTTQLANLGCTYTSQQMEQNHAAHTKTISAEYEKAATTKPKQYIVRD